jgi:hypothetical protein
LSEGGVNHKLIANGTSVLAQGSFAVIARNADAFRKDWPQFAGVLLTSSFSLHNSGETVSLKNETLETVSTITYDARYAKGDGNSLNFVVGEPVSRRPTPGSSVASDVLVSPVEEAPEATKKAITIGTIVQRNLSETVEVSEVDAIDGGGMDGGVYAASFIDGGGAPGMSLMSLMPWFVSLLAVMGVGISAILFRKKKSKSGYTIIEEKS